jgi:hypothetical protein
MTFFIPCSASQRRALEQRFRNFPIIHEFEETEKTGPGLFVLINRIDGRGDRPHVTPITRGYEIGDSRVIEIGILGGVEELFPLEIERRDPVWVAFKNREPSSNEAFGLSWKRDSSHFE